MPYLVLRDRHCKLLDLFYHESGRREHPLSQLHRVTPGRDETHPKVHDFLSKEGRRRRSIPSAIKAEAHCSTRKGRIDQENTYTGKEIMTTSIQHLRARLTNRKGVSNQMKNRMK